MTLYSKLNVSDGEKFPSETFLPRKKPFGSLVSTLDLLRYTPTVVPTKSDSDDMFCLQLLRQTLTCTHHLS